MSQNYRNLAVTLMLVLLSACGFKLRGQAQLPPELAHTYIRDSRPVGAPPTQLALALKRALETNGVVITSEPESATATIVILSTQNHRRTIATGSEGQVREYELRYEVDYEVSLADKTKLIPKDTLIISRDALYDEARVLGRAAGEELLIRDMVADVTYSIIRRLQAVAQSGGS